MMHKEILLVEDNPDDVELTRIAFNEAKVANHAWYTLWYVIPTLPMFAAFPALPRLGFWPTLLACVLLTVVCFGLFAALLRRFGIELL